MTPNAVIGYCISGRDEVSAVGAAAVNGDWPSASQQVEHSRPAADDDWSSAYQVAAAGGGSCSFDTPSCYGCLLSYPKATGVAAVTQSNSTQNLEVIRII